MASLPKIEVRSDGELRGALGAFSAQTGKIYLSEGLVTGDPARLQAVLIEEIGHFIDAQVNGTDTPGDEGELFAKVVLGQPVSSAELVRLRAENDQAVVMIDGQAVAIEQNTPPNIAWTRLLGGSNFDSAYAMTTGTDGSIYVSGDTISNLDGQTNNGNTDVFIARYDATGNKIWTKLLGSSEYDYARAMTTGTDGSIYVSGETISNLDGQTNNGGRDAFVTKYDTSGNKIWTKLLGGSSYDSAYAMTTGTDGSIYVSGYTGSNVLDGQANNGNGDAFITKYDTSGNKIWTKLLGGSGEDRADAMTTGTDGSIYVSGYTLSSVLDGQTNNGSMDAFVTKYDTSGNKIWTKLLGGNGEDRAYGMTTGTDGSIYVSGYTRSSVLDGQTNNGSMDAFVTKYDTSGNKIWTKLLGGSSYDLAYAMTTGTDGSIYVSGDTGSNMLDGQANNGSSDAFVIKLGTDLLPVINLSVSPNSVTEDGTSNIVYTFTRTGDTTNALTINYSIAGTADATDYTGATPGTGTITFTAGSSTATLILDPTADTTIENDETVSLTLASGTGYTIETTTAVTGTITNDDFPRVTLAVSPASVTEDGTTNLVYTFTRTGATTNALTVNYSIAGTADTTDYTGATPGTGTITFTAGSSTATLTIDPTADTTIESNETVILTLASGTGYTVGTTTAVTGTILNDDPKITLALSPATVTEDGTENLVYTFTRTGATTNALTVNYSISGTAISTDYTGATPGTGKTITFAAGSTTATLTIDPTADTVVEPNETVTVSLVAGTGYFLGTTTSATGTIRDDDTSAVSLSMNYQGISEDSPSNLVYTFTRVGATANALTVNYNIAGTATTTDYTGATPGNGKTITFTAGSSTATLTLDPTADTTSEANETISLQLAAGTGYTISTTAAQIATIINDDSTRRQVGTSGKDLLLGTSSNDYLIGGAGDDELTGGTGNDIFYFASPNLGNDRLTDFTPNEDSLFVSGQGFGGGLLAGDTLTSAQFVLGSSATNTSQRFIYNSTTGALWFDVDGNGTQAAKQIATLNTGLALTFEDIFVA